MACRPPTREGARLMTRLLAVMALLMVIAVACGGQDDEATPTPTEGQRAASTSSPQTLIDRLGMAIDRDGAVYQTTIIASGTENGEPQGDLWRDELWIYPDEQQARHLFHLGPPGTDDIPAQTIFMIDDNRI